ncbi:MAG TPA: NADH-quinone oxidoreductase subunit NuoG [Actinomycetota bacterium]|nr:NADH-quinone oxidoreductase subunit NuoG [Actinomycetota bacterium]
MNTDVTLTIDGTEVTVPAGTLIIRAAERLGIEIPRFCEHPLLEPVGACRQCYVRVEGQPKLTTSCTVPVTPGMVVRTQTTDPEVAGAQRANLEFLLLNHPLDCPICDRGGECPLQDQALAYGPGDSRFREAKRVFKKPIPLSPLIALDRERCVLCTRCTRFCDEISGDRFIELYERGAGERVAIAAGEDFRSPFSGNTVQICPVGALTSVPYRFVARPFDLTYGDSVCPHCSAGCNLRVDVRRGEVVRHLARDEYEVNDAWLCDKGRYAHRFPDSPARITLPLIRDRGLEPASFGEVFERIAGWVDGKRVAVLAGGRLMDEDAYALSKLARTVFHTNDLDHRRSAAPEAEVTAARAPMSVTYRDVERASAIVIVGLDAEQEVPILHLRLRKAAAAGARIWVIHPRRTRLHDVATHVLVRPGEEARMLAGGADPVIDEALSALRAAGERGVVLAGERPSAADAALLAARAAGAAFAYVTRRAGDRGALRAGVHPSLLPGGRRLGEADAVDAAWGTSVPREPGRDWRGVLQACADREIDVLFLVGIDPITDYPDAELSRSALQNVPVKIVQGLELGSLERYADVFLPAAPYLEREGHLTTWEGRGQRLHRVRSPEGLSLPDWELFATLALACGADLGFETLEELQDEMGSLLAPLGPAPTTGELARSDAAPDGGTSSTLFTYPLLVDEGRLAERADELKDALMEEPFVELHPADAATAGVADGQAVHVRTEAGKATLPARVTPNVAKGAVFVPFNQRGFEANVLLGGDFVTSATVEPADELIEAAADAGGA